MSIADIYRKEAEAEANSFREYLVSLDRDDLLEITVALSADAGFWKALYMRASKNTPPAELK